MTVRLDLGPELAPEHAAEATQARKQLRAAITKLATSPPGFIEILDEGDAIAERCRAEAAQLTHFETIVVLGIGGSALGARAVRDALAPEHASRLVVIDNIDPDTIVRTRDSLDPKRTAFFIVSKSGSTAETAAQMILFRTWLEEAGRNPAEQMFLITDPENGPLRALASRDRVEQVPVAVKDIEVERSRSDHQGHVEQKGQERLRNHRVLGAHTQLSTRDERGGEPASKGEQQLRWQRHAAATVALSGLVA